jgi:nucleotide-binding universal stress UspA family protein
MTTESQPRRNRIVVGVDGSEQSRLALAWSTRIADATGAEIDAVIACQDPAAASLGYLYPEWDPQSEATKHLEEAVDAAFPAGRPIGMRLLVRPGGAAKVLLAESEGATMLIVGSRGYGGFTGLLLGSVSAACAEHASCPVLVVHEGAPATAPVAAS